jgi:IS1 family transposase
MVTSTTVNRDHPCKDCGRQFVDCFEQHLVSDETRDLIERLWLERLSLRGIYRAVKVGLKWLLGFIVTCFETLPDHLNVQPISCDQDVMIQRLEVEADEMASFVQKKSNKQWIWLAMDVKTRQIIAFHVGDRSRKSAKKLRACLWRTASRRRFIRISMWCMKASSPLPNTERSTKKLARPITSNASITPCGSGYRDWYAVRCRFPKSWTITSVPFNISFAITI